MSTYIVKNEDLVVPASPLDNILTKQGITVEYNFHSVYDGTIIDDSNRSNFYSKVIENTIAKKYEHTDHLFISMKIKGIHYGYVSLDNSVRANQFGSALKNRLSTLCEAIIGFIRECNNSCVIFFSESCRPSFDGNDLSNRINEMTWFEIREHISDKCNLYYLGESANNEDSNNMAFGVSAFCTNNCRPLIHSVLPKRILNIGFGSGTIGIKMKNGDTIWGIHFPLDFRMEGEDNLGAKTMKGLCALMKTCLGDSYAFGNFVTIPGKIERAVGDAIDDDMSFAVAKQLTFFGSYYDTVRITSEDDWTPFV